MSAIFSTLKILTGPCGLARLDSTAYWFAMPWSGIGMLLTRGNPKAPRATFYYYHTRNNILFVRQHGSGLSRITFLPFLAWRALWTTIKVNGGGVLGRKRNVALAWALSWRASSTDGADVGERVWLRMPSATKRRILFLNHGAVSGGSETEFMRLLRHFHALQGYEVYGAYPEGPLAPAWDKLCASRCVYKGRLPRLPRLRTYVGQVVYGADTYPAWPCFWLAKKLTY